MRILEIWSLTRNTSQNCFVSYEPIKSFLIKRGRKARDFLSIVKHDVLRITMTENYPAFACYRPVDDRELWLIRQCRIFYILKNPTTWRSHDPNFNWQLCASIIFSTSFNCTVYCTVYSYHRYLLFVSANSVELGFDSLAFFRLFTVSDAWFEPGLAASAVWCFTNELQLFVFARKVSFVVPLPSRTGQLDCEG